MKFLVGPGEPLRIAGASHPPGAVVEIIGREQHRFFGARLVPITQPALIAQLAVNAHPHVAVEAFTWGRKPYAVGDIYWAATRSDARLLGTKVRPATGDEVLAWLARQPAGPPPAAPPPDPDAPVNVDAPLPFVESKTRLPSRKEREAAKKQAEEAGAA